MPNVEVLHGNCVDLMRAMPDNSVDSIVTDPPYGLEFMGKEWDKLGWQSGGGFSKPGIGERQTDWVSFSSTSRYGAANPTCGVCGGRARGKKRCECEEPQWKPIGKRRNPENEGLPDDVTGGGMSAQMTAMQRWHYEWAAEALRVLKPGGHLLAFGGTRTYHRMACAIEDAGFEIRDSIHWVYGSGFPKSHDVSKAIDKAAGAERARLEPRKLASQSLSLHPTGFNADGWSPQVNEPVTEDAAKWKGWGTALKPAHEPVVVARKPLSGTVAANVLKFGTGGINIDGCRVGTDEDTARKPAVVADTAAPFGKGVAMGGQGHESGRWPANIVLDGAAAKALDQQSGVSKDGVAVKRNGVTSNGVTGWGKAPAGTPDAGGYGGSGGASRFFTQADFEPDDWPFVYQAKPSKRERNAGLDGLPEQPSATAQGMGITQVTANSWGDKDQTVYERTTTHSNHHPTVKPVALMRHLVRLVTPHGGTVLDPFAGSGTTLVAAVLEGFDAIGCEMTDEYLPIIEGRVAWAQENANGKSVVSIKSDVQTQEQLPF